MSAERCSSTTMCLAPHHKEKIQQLQERIEALERPGMWVPVSERLPPPHTHVLCLNRGIGGGRRFIFEGCICYGLHTPFFTYPRGDGNPSNTHPDWIDVTHWTELPELPAQGERG